MTTAPIWQKIHRLCEEDLLYQSRVHILPQFATGALQVYIKREDESGFGISGTKKRKLASLVPALKQHQERTTWAIGSAYGNHIPALIQVLREQNLPFHLWLKRPHTSHAPRGNQFLSLLLAKPEEITWVEKSDWATLEKHLRQQSLDHESQPWVLPEGAFCKESIAGAATLMEDILRNERERGWSFDHIFLDAGTGLTAAVSSLLNAALGRSAQIHVVSMADPGEVFEVQWRKVQEWMDELLPGFTAPDMPLPIVHRPVQGASFGSVGRTQLEFIKSFARTYGVLLDPVYNAKLFSTVKEVVSSHRLSGKALIVHSGGGFSLSGFNEAFMGII